MPEQSSGASKRLRWHSYPSRVPWGRVFHVENGIDGRFFVANWLHAATLLHAEKNGRSVEVLRCVFEKVVVCRFAMRTLPLA